MSQSHVLDPTDLPKKAPEHFEQDAWPPQPPPKQGGPLAFLKRLPTLFSRPGRGKEHFEEDAWPPQVKGNVPDKKGAPPLSRLLPIVLPLVGARVIGFVLNLFLGSKAGRKTLARVDGRRLTPRENKEIAQKHASRLATSLWGASMVTLAQVRPGHPEGDEMVKEPRKRNTADLMFNLSALLLALGAILRVVGGFLQERQETERARREELRELEVR